MNYSMRFGPSMEVLYDNVLTGSRDTETLTRESIFMMRLNYTQFRNRKYNFYETLDDALSSKYVIHTLNLIEE